MAELQAQGCVTPVTESLDSRTLRLERLLAAPRAAIWRCWTEPELIKLWFCPAPWRVTEASVELRPGGRSFVLMQGPNGERHPHHGVYLDVVAGERLVFTDAFVEAWQPSNEAFMVGRIDLADAPGGTRYVATVTHWSVAATERHAAMGFHEGWGVCADQLESLAKTI